MRTGGRECGCVRTGCSLKAASLSLPRVLSASGFGVWGGQVERRVEELEGEVTLLERENEALRGRLHSLSDALQVPFPSAFLEAFNPFSLQTVKPIPEPCAPSRTSDQPRGLDSSKCCSAVWPSCAFLGLECDFLGLGCTFLGLGRAFLRVGRACRR